MFMHHFGYCCCLDQTQIVTTSTTPQWVIPRRYSLIGQDVPISVPVLAPFSSTSGPPPSAHTECLGTIENHGNTEITETVILSKCRECHVLPCFLLKCRGFTFFYKNTLFLISKSWSLLYEQKNNYLCFCLCYQSPCALLVTYLLNMWPWRHRRNMYLS